MIVCGFAGIGKSTLCKEKPMWIDLESTPFEKDWDRYIKVAMHMDKQGYNVMLSCHAELRKRLHENGARYYVVMPLANLKEEYLNRYKKRGNAPAFIESIEKNWDAFTEFFEWEYPIYLKAGQYLSDIAGCLGMNGSC